MSETTPEPVSDLDKLPNKLSPSRAKMFENCPKSFYFRTIKKLPTKNTVANTRGTLAHEALEEIFKLPREERTPEKAHTFVEPAWRKIENRDSYKDMVEPGSDEEKEMLEYAKQMVTNAFKIENIRGFDAGALEYHAEADINGLTLHGYIDRLDEAPIDGEPRAFISDYKGLALPTPLPTPTGWTTMGDVAVGDQLLGTDGNPVTVVNKSQIHHDRPCYLLTFTNGDTLHCDNVHLLRINVISHGATEMRVVDADTLAAIVDDPEVEKIYIDGPEALDLPEQDLPVDPLVFGAWLANSDQVEPGVTGAGTFVPAEIPSEYLRSSIRQRIRLLDGLKTAAQVQEDGRVVFNEEVENAVLGLPELVRTLGYAPRVDYQHGCRNTSFVEEQGEDRVLKSMQSIDSIPTQCVEVDADDSMYLAGNGMVPTHNTGKIPRDRYLDDAFFAMRIYALLLFEETGKMPHMLRLIYLKGENAEEALRRVVVTPELIERTRRDVNAIWRRIKTAAATGNWPTKTGPLCNFCDFKPMCPAFGGEG